MCINITLRRVHAVVKAVLHVVSVLFVALGIQHAMGMRHIFVCGLHHSTAFFHLSRKRHDLKNLLNIKCVFWFSLQLLFETFIIVRRTELDMRWAGHVARMVEERGCIGSWWGNRRERDH